MQDFLAAVAGGAGFAEEADGAAGVGLGGVGGGIVEVLGVGLAARAVGGEAWREKDRMSASSEIPWESSREGRISLTLGPVDEPLEALHFD